MSLKLRRGNTAQRLAITPDEGELIYDTESKQLYAGDGTTAGGVLVSYAGSVGGALGSDLVLSTHDITGSGNINITGTITSTGNIVSGGNITAQGNVYANGGTIELGDSNTDNVVFGADINSNFIPNTSNAFNLGSDVQRWNTLYVNNVFGDIEGSVRADDSSILVDARNGVLRGQLEGNLIGPVQGSVEGNVTGDVTGSVKAPNGVTVVNNGTDGTDAVFTGTFNGTLNGPVTNGVLTTGSYNNPLWITSLDAGKLFGTLNGVVVNGDLNGSVFSNDSTMLVDGINGVLRGTHIGDLDTGSLRIFNNYIASNNTNENIIISPMGTGVVDVPTTLKAGTINLTNDPVTGGLTVAGATNTARQVTLAGAYNDASSSASGGYSINFSRSRGTLSAQLPLQVGDELSTTVYTGLTGSLGYRAAAAVIVKTGTTVSDGVITGDLALAVNDGTGPTPTVRLTIKQDGVVRFDSPTLTAGQVNTGSVATYLKVMIGGTAYAIPAYALV